jgi:hypothetical protein
LEVTVEEMMAGWAEARALPERALEKLLGMELDGERDGGGWVPVFAARAFAAATVCGLRRKGWGALEPPEGSMLLRKSIMLSSLCCGRAGAAELGSAVKRSSSSSSESIAYGSLTRRRVRLITGSSPLE